MYLRIEHIELELRGARSEERTICTDYERNGWDHRTIRCVKKKEADIRDEKTTKKGCGHCGLGMMT